MSQFDTFKSITSRLKELSDQLSSSKLSQEELEEFETLSRKLYEIIIILNYKAKEEVYKSNSTKKEEPKKTKKESNRKDDSENKENNAPRVKKRREGTKPSPGLIEFDFSGGPAPSKDTSPSETRDIKINDERDDQSEDTTEVVEQPEVKEATPVQNEAEQNIEQENDTEEREITAFYQHFTVTYKETLKDKLSNSKIDSIKNAIGLNEKLQFIGELFGGSSELFNQTIEELDQLENNEIAIKRLSEIAAQKRWDKETELVDQFANIVNRRYVE